MWTLLLIFACKTPKYADTGEGVKNGQILRTSFIGWPIMNLSTLDIVRYQHWKLYVIGIGKCKLSALDNVSRHLPHTILTLSYDFMFIIYNINVTS